MQPIQNKVGSYGSLIGQIDTPVNCSVPSVKGNMLSYFTCTHKVYTIETCRSAHNEKVITYFR